MFAGRRRLHRPPAGCPPRRQGRRSSASMRQLPPCLDPSFVRSGRLVTGRPVLSLALLCVRFEHCGYAPSSRGVATAAATHGTSGSERVSWRRPAVPCLVSSLQTSPVAVTPDGLYTASVWPGRVRELVYALEPDGGSVVVEDQLVTGPGAWTPAHGVLAGSWSDLPPDVLVRSIRLDLLMPPQGFVTFAPSIEGVAATGIEFWQSSRRTPPQVHIANKRGAARRKVFVGVDIVIAVMLPHEGEVASLTAPTSDRVEAALDRIRRATAA